MRPRQSILLIALLFLTAVFLLAGCSPAKKVLKEQKAYREIINDHLLNNPPVIDTIVRFTRGSTSIQSRFIAVTDTAELQKAKDSMHASFVEKNKLQAMDCERQVSEAFDVGYSYAREEMGKQKDTIRFPDTVKVNIYPTTYIEVLKQQAATVQGRLIECENKTSYLWHFIIAAAFCVVLLFIVIQLSTAKK